MYLKSFTTGSTPQASPSAYGANNFSGFPFFIPKAKKAIIAIVEAIKSKQHRMSLQDLDSRGPFSNSGSICLSLSG
jgi:hypothetical protein